jgi:hypothetical protein
MHFIKTPAVFHKLWGFLLQSRADSFIIGVSHHCLQYPGNQKNVPAKPNTKPLKPPSAGWAAPTL